MGIGADLVRWMAAVTSMLLLARSARAENRSYDVVVYGGTAGSVATDEDERPGEAHGAASVQGWRKA